MFATLSEVALRVHFTCCVFLSIELWIQRPLTSSISAEVGNCSEVEETALHPCPTSFPIARSMSSLSDAIPCLQSSCRNRGLIGESGRDDATKFTFFNSVRSLLTVPVPKASLGA